MKEEFLDALPTDDLNFFHVLDMCSSWLNIQYIVLVLWITIFEAASKMELVYSMIRRKWTFLVEASIFSLLEIFSD